MPYLQHIRTASRLSIKYRQQPLRRLSTPDDKTICKLTKKGVLQAFRISSQNSAEFCEWTLFTADTRLTPGWLLQRVHWFGDVQQTHFVANPTGTDSPFIKVRLRIPAATQGRLTKNKKTRFHKVGIRLLSLRGPMNQDWVGSFER